MNLDKYIDLINMNSDKLFRYINSKRIPYHKIIANNQDLKISLDDIHKIPRFAIDYDVYDCTGTFLKTAIEIENDNNIYVCCVRNSKYDFYDKVVEYLKKHDRVEYSQLLTEFPEKELIKLFDEYDLTLKVINEGDKKFVYYNSYKVHDYRDIIIEIATKMEFFYITDFEDRYNSEIQTLWTLTSEKPKCPLRGDLVRLLSRGGFEIKRKNQNDMSTTYAKRVCLGTKYKN